MRVIIPAAGRGTRLQPFTNSSSKALVPVCGRPLLSYTLEWLAELDVSEVVVVAGHHGAGLRVALTTLPRRPPLRFVENPRYASTNSIYSLWLTTPCWTEPFCVIDGDVLSSRELLRGLVSGGPSALVIDTTKSWNVADMKVELRDGSVWHMDKTIEAGRHHGEFFGLSRWSGEGQRLLAETLQAYVDAGNTNVWYEFPMRDVAKRTPLAVLPAREGDWAEIDRPEDIAAGEWLIGRLIGAR